MTRNTVLAAMAALMLTGCNCNNPGKDYSWEKDLQGRLEYDFCKTREEVKAYIQNYIPDVQDEQIDAWTEAGILESIEIDGQTLYFNRTASNLFRVDPECKAIKQATLGQEAVSSVNPVIPELLACGNTFGKPIRMHVKYTLTVDADAVPAGETIRCWLPYPRTDVTRQKDVKLISTSHKATASDPECRHCTMYMETKAVAGQPTIFTEEFEYSSYGEVHIIDPSMVQPYDTNSELYKEFTAQREKHIIFSDRIKALADSLTAGIENPYLQAKAIFTWIDNNFPWAGAREYSTIENIPEYVLDIRHGDCGQKTLLMLTMCRYKGIPGHFQSGFDMKPGDDGMHDWAELWFEGIGWVPVDQSRGLTVAAEDETTRYFYLGSIDPYRMIVNQDYGMPLSPAKKFPRSETVDFQRGEVEWAGGNLYFNQWDYNMEIQYL